MSCLYLLLDFLVENKHQPLQQADICICVRVEDFLFPCLHYRFSLLIPSASALLSYFLQALRSVPLELCTSVLQFFAGYAPLHPNPGQVLENRMFMYIFSVSLSAGCLFCQHPGLRQKTAVIATVRCYRQAAAFHCICKKKKDRAL